MFLSIRKRQSTEGIKEQVASVAANCLLLQVRILFSHRDWEAGGTVFLDDYVSKEWPQVFGKIFLGCETGKSLWEDLHLKEAGIELQQKVK